MKKVVVQVVDRGKPSVYATDPLDDEGAQVERARIEREHIEAGDGNRWIRVGGTSILSKQLVSIRVEEATPRASGYFGDDEPPFRRGMSF